jgi:thioesterase domain-containing protein
MYQVISPDTPAAFKGYYHFRWRQLRQPWDQPEGSEKDEYDSHAMHRMIVDENNHPVAVARLHLTSLEEGQIRFMAVDRAHRCKGLGTLLLSALEEEAKIQGVRRLMLNAKEDAIAFYSNCGYETTGDAPTLYGSISYLQMKKQLSESGVIIRDPKWCQQLQQTWHDDIPISHVMGIRVHQYTGELFETRAALNPNLNLHGTMFAGSIYSLATLTGWGLIHLWLKNSNKEGNIVLGDGSIHYHKPVSQQPGAVVRMSDIQGDLSALDEGKKVRLKVKVEVRDGTKAVAEFTGLFVILPK